MKDNIVGDFPLGSVGSPANRDRSNKHGAYLASQGPRLRPVIGMSVAFRGRLLRLSQLIKLGQVKIETQRPSVELKWELNLSDKDTFAVDLAILSLILPEERENLIKQLEESGLADTVINVGNRAVTVSDVFKDPNLASELINEHIKTYLKEERKKDPNRIIIAMLLWLMFQQIRLLHEKGETKEIKRVCITTTDLQELLRRSLENLLGRNSPLAERYLNEMSKSAFLRLLDEMSKARFIALLDQVASQETTKQRGRKPKAVLLTPAGIKYLYDILTTFASIGLVNSEEPLEVAKIAEEIYGKEIRNILSNP